MRLDPRACILGAALLLLLPLPWVLAAAAAAAVHELCHLGAVRALGGRVDSLTVGPAGAVMKASIPGRGRALLAAAAGPVGSLLLLALFRIAPRVAVCGLIQGLFNLLPLYPLDGGRMLRTALSGRISPGKMEALEGILGLFVCVLLWRWQAVLAVMVAIRIFFGKIPCKREKIRVQ